MNTTSFKNFFVSFSGIAVLLFLYFPLAVIVLFSFNADTVNSFPIQHFSLKWYSVLFSDDELLQSVGTSVSIAIVSTSVALIIGIPAAYAMHKYEFKGKKLIDKIVLMPITLPGIVTGVAMLSFFPFVGVKISLTAVTFGHITFLCAIVVTQMLARFKRLDPLSRASRLRPWRNTICNILQSHFTKYKNSHYWLRVAVPCIKSGRNSCYIFFNSRQQHIAIRNLCNDASRYNARSKCHLNIDIYFLNNSDLAFDAFEQRKLMNTFYEPNNSSTMRLLLRRTLVLYNITRLCAEVRRSNLCL